MKPRLILDFDSTIVDSNKAYCEAYNIMYQGHPDFAPADHTKINNWNYGDQCPLAVNDVERMFGNPLLFQCLEFFPDAKKSIEELTKYFDISICTIGSAKNISHKALWIAKNLPFISNVIYIQNAGGGSNEVKMDKSMVDMRGAFFLDDHIKNLNSSNASFKVCYGRTYKWNEDWDGLWVRDWNTLRKVFTIYGKNWTPEHSVQEYMI